ADGSDQDAEQGCAVLEEHHEGRRILASTNGLEKSEIASSGTKLAQRNQPRSALEQEGQSQYHVVDTRIIDGLRVSNVDDPLIHGHTRCHSEDQQRDDEAPEIEFATMPERMLKIGMPSGPTHPVEKQNLVAGIDERMHGLTPHRRASRPGRCERLRRRYQ